MPDHDAVSRPPTTPPDAEMIATLAERALAEIPAGLRRHVSGVSISVEEFADDETLDSMGIESEWDLTGEKPVMVSCRIVQPCQAVNAGRGELD